MLLLTSPNDQLQIVTSAAANIGVHATWVDTNTSTGAITPGRTNTSISTAATTSIAGSPAAGVQRNVKTLHLRNTHATLASDVTIQHTDGTVVAQLYKMTMYPADMLQYTDQGGFTRAGVQADKRVGGRLTLATATQLKFAPYEGGNVKLNGIFRSIPNAGIAGLANTGVRVNGTPGTNLTANATYLVFVTDVNGVLTADFWGSAAAAHGPSTAPGNEGTEIRKTSDLLTEYQTHSLIGMVRTNGSAQFQDDTSLRGVVSWHNRQTKNVLIGTTGSAPTNTTGPDVKLGSSIYMLNWGGEPTSATLFCDCGLAGSSFNDFSHIMVGRDTVATGHGGSLYVYGNGQITVPVSCGGFDAPAEGFHEYFCAAGTGSVAGMTHWVFNGSITGFTRG
jgi:hypothetical protein